MARALELGPRPEDYPVGSKVRVNHWWWPERNRVATVVKSQWTPPWTYVCLKVEFPREIKVPRLCWRMMGRDRDRYRADLWLAAGVEGRWRLELEVDDMDKVEG